MGDKYLSLTIIGQKAFIPHYLKKFYHIQCDLKFRENMI